MIALHVKIDDEAASIARPPGRPPKLSHSELIGLAVMEAMLGFHSDARWLRYARKHYGHLFPFLPLQSGYNKRLRAVLPQIKRMPKAKTAIARSILTIIFHLLADPTSRYHDLEADFYARHLDTRRRTDQLVRQLQALGHTATLTPAAA